MDKDAVETRLEDGRGDSASEKRVLDQDSAANQASNIETSLSVRDAFRWYWPAVAWSVCISNATIAESYMLLLPNSFYAQPQFQKQFGEQLPNGNYSIPAAWQIGVSMGGLIGLIIGVFANGYFADKFGLKKVMVTCHFSMLAFIFILFFAPNIATILVGAFFL